MYDQYGRRLSARQKLTRETLVFFGNFARQNGVVEHQLDVGFQAVTAIARAISLALSRRMLTSNGLVRQKNAGSALV